MPLSRVLCTQEMLDQCKHSASFIPKAHKAEQVWLLWHWCWGSSPPKHSFFFSTLGSMIRPEFSSPSILPLALLDLANSLTKCWSAGVNKLLEKNLLKCCRSSSSVCYGYQRALIINSMWQEVMNYLRSWNVTCIKDSWCATGGGSVGGENVLDIVGAKE